MIGVGELVDDLSEIKSESTYKDSFSDSSTATGSVSSIRFSSSRWKSQSSRKMRIKKMSQVREKFRIIARNLSSDESTDELEDVEPVTHSCCTKRKRLALIQDSPLMPKKKAKLTRPQGVHFLSNNTTDDIEGENELDVRTSNKASDSVLGRMTTRCSKPIPKPDPAVIPCQTTKGKSPLKLKKLSRVRRFTEMESATTKALILVAHDVSVASDDTHEKEDNTVHPKASLSETNVHIVSIDELNDFENFSDTVATSEDKSVVKQKKLLKKQLLVSTDVEPSNESLEIHHKRRKDNSVDKVQVWLDSRNESYSSDMIAKPDSQTKEVSIPFALANQPVSVQPSLGSVVCDKSNGHSHAETWSATVTSNQGQGDVERQTNVTEEISVIDRFSPDSSSSADSSLPAVIWEHQPKRDDEETTIKPTPTEIKEPPVSNHHVQSLVVSPTETPHQSKPVEEYQNVSETSAEGEFQQTKSEVKIPASTVAFSSPIGKSLEVLKLKEFSLKVNRIETVSSIHKPAFGSPKLKVINVDVTEDMEVTPPTNEMDTTYGVSHLEGKTSSELAIANEPFKSINNSGTASRLDLVHVKESVSKSPGSGNKQQPVSLSSCLQKSSKHQAKEVKSTGRVLLTEVPGMKYSSRKAILKTNIDAQLPSQSSRTQSGGVLLKRKEPSASSVLSHRSCVDEHVSSTSLLEASSSVQPSRSHAMKRSGYVKDINISQSSQETDVVKPLSSTSVRQPCRIQLNKVSLNPKDSQSPSPGTSKTSKESKLIQSSTSIPKPYQKLSGTSPGYRSPSSLSVETQRLLDSVGQSSRLAIDKAISVSRHEHISSTNMLQLHVVLKPRVLPKADDLLTEVLSWEAGAFLIPQQTENGKLIEPTVLQNEELINVPKIFESYDRYFDTFKPLIFLELSSMVGYI